VANSPQAKKRARQAEKRRQNNVAHHSRMRTKVKNTKKAIEAKAVEDAQKAFQIAVPTVDSMVNKGIIHRNKAARIKSRLAKRLNTLLKQA
jgi:small subunit ribosomal protein S20